MKKIIVILTLLFATSAFAGSVDLNWTLPVTDCDGSSVESYGATIILWGFTDGGPYPNEFVVFGTATSATLDVGDVEGQTVFIVAIGEDEAGNRTDCGVSNQVSVPFPANPPSHPTGLTGAVSP